MAVAGKGRRTHQLGLLRCLVGCASLLQAGLHQAAHLLAGPGVPVQRARHRRVPRSRTVGQAQLGQAAARKLIHGGAAQRIAPRRVREMVRERRQARDHHQQGGGGKGENGKAGGRVRCYYVCSS